MMIVVNEDNYFDAASALHWYCNDYHSGQYSALYSIQCRLGYKPGSQESGCEDGYSSEIYESLECGEIYPDTLLQKIQDVLRNWD
jgi:hypothetical protein